jgi:hypothetical protein
VLLLDEESNPPVVKNTGSLLFWTEARIQLIRPELCDRNVIELLEMFMPVRRSKSAYDVLDIPSRFHLRVLRSVRRGRSLLL